MDQEAFRALYDRTLPHVYGYLAHRGGNAIAEDLTQETYIAAAHAFQGGAGEVTLPWLLAVARNKLVDHFRRAERQERKILRLSRLASRGSASEALPLDPPEVGKAMQVLAALPAAQRAALVLHHIDDKPVSEVAGLLGRSEEAVESLLARGRRAFRSHYQELSDD